MRRQRTAPTSPNPIASRVAIVKSNWRPVHAAGPRSITLTVIRRFVRGFRMRTFVPQGRERWATPSVRGADGNETPVHANAPPESLAEYHDACAFCQRTLRAAASEGNSQ